MTARLELRTQQTTGMEYLLDGVKSASILSVREVNGTPGERRSVGSTWLRPETQETVSFPG